MNFSKKAISNMADKYEKIISIVMPFKALKYQRINYKEVMLWDLKRQMKMKKSMKYKK